MDNQEKYFILEEYDPKENFAMIKLSNKEQTGFHLAFTDPIEMDEPFEFEFRKPYPKRAIMADYHYWERIVFSERIKEVLESFNLPLVDYFEAEISDRKMNTYDEYWVLHIRNRIACLNKEKSTWKPPAFDPNEVMEIYNMVLDMDRLEKIPLQERLVFDLEECHGYTLFHESVVDEISKLKPTGFKFVSVGAWHSNIGWEII